MTIKKNDTVYEDIFTFFVDDLEAAQKYGTHEAFEVLKGEGIEEIIEIGTCRGGFALMLRMVFPDAEIFTFDISEWDPIPEKREAFRANGIHFFKEDAFKSMRLVNLIKNDKRTLILCDGAHKNLEFCQFAPFMTEGSFIGAHDYFANGRCNQDIWTTCEMWYTQIENHVIDYNLREYRADVFAPMVWAMYQRVSESEWVHPDKKPLGKGRRV